MERILSEVLSCLEKLKRKKYASQVFVGFDGFVDTLVRPVRSNGSSERRYFQSIGEFASYLKDKQGKSCSIELEKITEKLGGNAAIYAQAISRLGIHTKCMGAFGYPKPLPLFQTKEMDVELISISNPGICTALEFDDGKIMLSENEGINDLNYERLVSYAGEGQLYRMVNDSAMVSLMNWSEVPGCTGIWKGFLDNIFPGLPKNERKKMFIDISDCSRRSKEDIRQMLALIRDFSDYCEITLSLNYNEFEIVSSVVGSDGAVDFGSGPIGDGNRSCSDGGQTCSFPDMEPQGHFLCEYCGLQYLIIHLRDGAYAFTKNISYYVDNRYVDHPMISTGGGDNFNAGLVYGIINGMGIEAAMTLGNAASGFYISHGRSATMDELMEYIHVWMQEREVAVCVG